MSRAYTDEHPPLEPWQQKLVTDNLRLVSWMASKFPLEDQEELKSVGYIGMCEAAQRYDASRGPFGSYAGWWVRARMNLFMRDSKTPVRLVTRRVDRKVFSGIGQARRDLGGEPTREAIAKHLDVPVDAVERIAVVLSKGGVVRLDERVAEKRPVDLADERAPSEDELIDRHDNGSAKERLIEALNVLDSRERRIVEACTLNDPPFTLMKVGASMGITRERARQIQARALDKIRAFLNVDLDEAKARRIYACSRCGATPRVPSSTLCKACKREYDREKIRAAKSHTKRVEQRRREGRCLRCGFRPAPGGELCASCE